MKKNILKISTIIMLVVLVVFAFAMPTFAAGAGTSDALNTDFNPSDTSGASSSIFNIINALLNMVQLVGIGVATIMLVVLAIKYISAAPNDKAEIKKHAVVYVVGAVILFSATGIISIIRAFAGNVKKG